MTFADALAALKGFYEASGDAAERHHLADDLQAMVRHAHAGEYAATSFLQRSAFDVGSRTREFVTYLEGWNRISQRWAAILEHVPLGNVDAVLDILPGWAPKIELALVHRGYAGEVFALDLSETALHQLASALQLFSPRFTFHPLVGDFFAPPVRRFDLVVANHVLDDVVLCMTAAGSKQLDLYENPSAITSAWASLLTRDPRDAQLADKVVTQLDHLVAPSGYLCLSQYPSVAEKIHGAERVTHWFQSMYSEVCERLRARGFADVGPRTEAFFLAQR